MIERRNEVAAGQVRLVVLDAVEGGVDLFGIAVKRLGQRFRNPRKFGEDLGALLRERRHTDRVKQLGGEAGERVPGPRDMVDIRKRDARFFQAIADGCRWKPGCVLDPIEPFFLNRGHQLAVAHQRCGSVPVIRVNSQNIHVARLSTLVPFRIDGGGTTHLARRATTGETRSSGLAENYPIPAAPPQHAAGLPAAQRVLSYWSLPVCGVRSASNLPTAA